MIPLLLCLSLLALHGFSTSHNLQEGELKAAPSSSGLNGGDLLSCIQKISPSARRVNESRYNDSRIGVNFRYDYFFPKLILNVTCKEDIQAAVKCAPQFGSQIVVMNGGHSFEGMSCTDDLLLHLDEFNDLVEFSTNEAGEAFIKVQSGIRLARLYGMVIQLAELKNDSSVNYIIGGGTCPTVGVTGHTLCGGYGMLGRQVGLTSDQVVEIELVNADGDLIIANGDNSYSDLFWAMRGACSSGFGIVVSLKLRLMNLASPAVTYIDLPVIPYDGAGVENMLLWWQLWSSEKAPMSCTSVANILKGGIHLQAVYLGAKSDDAFAVVVEQMERGLRGYFSADEIWSYSNETTFFETVKWWSQDSSLQTVEDLLSVKSLEPLGERSESRRKSKSLLALKRPVSKEGIRQLIQYRVSGALNAIEWKSYGGINKLSSSFYTDDRSPLLRGHLLEMHYGNSNSSSIEEDEQLVSNINEIGKNLSKYFAGPSGYIGYIDYELSHPGSSYFGLSNAQRLSEIRVKYDPKAVFSTPAVEYLYPAPSDAAAGTGVEGLQLYVGSFSNSISRWWLSSSGVMTFIDTTESSMGNPSWMLLRHMDGDSGKRDFVYTVNQVKTYCPNHVRELSGVKAEIPMGAVSSYEILSDGSLKYINSVCSGGGSPNNAASAIIRDGTEIVYVANSCGTVSVLETDMSGFLIDIPLQIVVPSGEGSAALSCNSASFLHQVYVWSSRLYVVDRDLDAIHRFDLDPESGLLITSSRVTETMISGSGPRHMIIHPSGKYAFLVSEFANTMSVLSVSVDGSLTVLSITSMLRTDESSTDMSAGEVKLSNDGVFVYGSNRDNSDPNQNRSSIVVFIFNASTGELSLIQHISSEGIHPRHFDIFLLQDKNEVDRPFKSSWRSIMVVGNKDTDSLATFFVDKKDGTLTFTGNTVSTQPYHDEPVFVMQSPAFPLT